MRRTIPFLLALVTGLAILVLVGYSVLTRTTRAWFESDLAIRSGLAVASAKQSLVDSWEANPARLRATLNDITRDERVLGAAAYHEPPTVFRYYRAADACYVSSLHDGRSGRCPHHVGIGAARADALDASARRRIQRLQVGRTDAHRRF